MADEIKMTAAITVLASNFNETINPGQISIDLPSGPVLASEAGLQTCATTAGGVDLKVGNVTSSNDGGIFFFRNTDTTASNNIEIGENIGGTFYAWLLLQPGEFATGRLSSRYPAAQALRCRSTQNAPVLQYRIFSGSL
tara:strand:- start:600 stop:1016 length:417 start_codon:yes stop_codon:yes gene_type:complete